MHPLTGAISKVTRADEQYNALISEVDSFIEDKPYVVRFDHDSRTGENFAFFHPIKEPPLDWAIRLGEIFHDLRSALDHAIYALTMHVSHRERTGSEFPIFKDQGPYLRTEPGGGLFKVRGIGGQGKAIVEDVQPFRARYRGSDPERDPLWALHQLSNIDKHRTLHMCYFQSASAKIIFAPPAAGNVTVYGTRRLDEGTELARWTTRAPMQVNCEVMCDIALDERWATVIRSPPIRELVPLLATRVDEILAQLAVLW